MKRRTFLTKSSLATLGLSLAPYTGTNLLTDKSSKLGEIGFQVYTVRNQVRKNLSNTLKELSKTGYEYAEVYGLFADSVMGHPVKDIKREFKSAGIEIRSAHCSTGAGTKNKGTFANEWQMGVDVATELGIKHMVCPYLGATERKTIDGFKRTAELLNKSGEICKKSGIQLGYHNHAFEFESLEGQIPFDILTNETDADLVKIELDIYWAVKAGQDPIQLFEKHSGRINQWHVKEMVIGGKGEMTEVGNGRIDWANIFSQAKLSGMKNFYVEQDSNWTTTDVESLKTSFSYLKKLEY